MNKLVNIDNNFIDALNKKCVNNTPVWLMRQAGRYMKEYQAVRRKVGFIELCKNPELVCEVTITACQKLEVDAAIIFADILLIAESLGLEVVFRDSGGPAILNPVLNLNSINVPSKNDIKSSMQYVFDAVSLTRKSLNKNTALIGFAGAPFTLACYFIEGSGSHNYYSAKSKLLSDRDFFHSFMNILSDITIEYLNLQIINGADTVQLFDSWVGILDDSTFVEMVLPYIIKIRNNIENNVPFIYFGNGASHLYKHFKSINATAYSVDWRTNIEDAWLQIDSERAIQGNLDPAVLLTDFETIKKYTHKILDANSSKLGFIFNLGHGILPQTPYDNVKYLVDLVHNYNIRRN